MSKFEILKSKKVLIGIGVAGAIAIASIIPIRLAIAFNQNPEPQAIMLLCGSSKERVDFTINFWKSHSDLKIWYSGACSLKFKPLFRQAGVPDEKVIFDLRATDTVTHFTTLADDLVTHNIRHVYLITHEFHMGRSRAIASVVFGSKGITTTPVPIPSNDPSESPLKTVRDCLRSVLWLTTGETGAGLNPHLSEAN
jgi:uncharacterized SAM-binding protein YcdF (DUF218 family)